MAIDLQKRNRVIRKYLDGSGEAAPPIPKECLKNESGDPVNAVLMDFDDDDELTCACAIVNRSSIINLKIDNAEVAEVLRDLRHDPMQSGTVVVDTSTLPRGKNVWPVALALGMLADGRYERFYGKSTEELAHELTGLNLATGENEHRIITVSLEEFFDGNDQNDSIAPNLASRHPGIKTFRDVLSRIQSRPDVLSVRVSILEWPFADDEEDNDMWMVGESVFVWAQSLSLDELKDLVRELKCDDIGDVNELPHLTVPAGGPRKMPGMRLFQLFWD